MQFSGNLYRGDKLVAADVLGVTTGRNGALAGTLVLKVGDTLEQHHPYMLVMDTGPVVEIFAVQARGEPHQASVVDFISTRALRKAAKAMLESCEAAEQNVPTRSVPLR
jgi:hypothetical protein